MILPLYISQPLTKMIWPFFTFKLNYPIGEIGMSHIEGWHQMDLKFGEAKDRGRPKKNTN